MRTSDEFGWMSDPDMETVASTEAKNLFGALLDKAIGGKKVVITRRDAPKAVMVGFEEFESLTRRNVRTLNTLSEVFDARLAQMQTAKARAATRKAFDASPKQLGRAAVRAARRRG
jgi:antitoxin Phd